MRRYLTFLAVSLLLSLCVFAQTTAITASHISQSLNGPLLPAGQLCLTPVNTLNMPTGFQANGTQYLPQQACYPVTNGAVSGVTVPDTVAASPAIGYSVSVTDPTGATIYNFPQPIYPTGTSWSLDAWSPTQAVAVSNPTSISKGVSAPQGRCGTNPAIYYTASGAWVCFNQVWVPLSGTSAGSLTGSAITGALGYTPVTPTQLTSQISSQIAAIPALTSSQIATGIGYTPAAASSLANYLPLLGGTLSGTLTLNDGSPAASQAYVQALLGGSGANPPAATPTFSPAGGSYTAAQTVALADSTSGAAISYCVNMTGNCTPNTTYSAALNVAATETICASALVGSGGVVSSTACNTYTINTGTPANPITNIGTIIAQGYLTDGSVAYKTCSAYPGAVCNGGVGATVPSSVPTHTFGLNTPSANTGLSNKVGHFHLETASPKPSFTEALWTTTGGGIGVNPTATNFYVGGWIKESYAAGQSRIEFDPYAFDSGWDWMFGTQCNHDTNLIQYDNQPPPWRNTNVGCAALYDGNYHHVEMTFHRTLAGDTSCGGGPCEYWDTISIDGKTSALNVSLPATSSNWTGSGWQFQIDGSPTNASSGTPATYDLWVDSAQFIAGTAPSSTGSPGGAGGTTSGTGDLDSFNFDASTSIPAGLTPVGSPSISTAQYHSSPNSAYFPSGLNYFTNVINPVNSIYSRQYIYVSAESGTGPCTFLRYYNGNVELFVYYFSTNGYVSYYDQASGASVTAAASAISTGAWHLVETYTKIDPAAGHVTVKIDGVQTYDSGPINTGSGAINNTWFGNIGNSAPTGWVTYQDNVDFDDSNWIGPI